ncbi:MULTISPECIES: LacI family DNA-binding transcriptional regulator [unclassified Halomonas]|uniref:LacI family DNA-binding transcriptional regulator n=1 Tax=unclassified Halomonas TaxID=2609666 RepID=UPI0009903F8E|nr:MULTISPECIES: substrate-binding domain-containing protein [unclassified Halomonas]AQU81949.1 LacI family transcriptional regulator [Halomonas sp. 'Soap Lake \
MSSSRATLIEVAKLAGTSKTSVSRFFGPERDKLSPVLQSRIEQAAKSLGYQPNLMARGLKGGGSRLLGMLVADIRNPFSVAIVHGVEQAARAHGYSLIVCNTDNDPEQEQQHLASLAAYQVEGLIINAAGQPEPQLQALMKGGIPLALLDREVRQLDVKVIGLDNVLAIDMALDHLVQQGYRSVLYVSETPEYASARLERLKRFNQQAEALGLESQTLVLSSLTEHSAIPTLKTFAEHPTAVPKAVLCANGNATLAMVRSFQRLGLAMGPLGLIGIDELDWCELVLPGITTLAQPTDMIGQAAIACLLNQLPQRARELPVQYRHSPTLITRGSTTFPG